MMITVILCTYNRCHTLATALNSVAASLLPPSIGWEVLVIDNNSSDGTRQVAEQLCNRYPGRFRYLFEARQGKSYALNTGIREAQGDVLAFMDDDVTVEPSWLRNLTAGLDAGKWAGAGGKIVLDWPASVPKWLFLDGQYARHGLPGFDQGFEPKELEGPPFGTNMAFPKSVFLKYGGFRTDLGPRPGSEIRSEDTEFGRRLLAAGERLRYEPLAVVYHPVPADRMTKGHLLDWWFDRGRAEIREFGIPPGVKFLGIPLKLLASILLWAILWLVALEPRMRFYRRLVLWERAGKILECFRQSFATPKQAA